MQDLAGGFYPQAKGLFILIALCLPGHQMNGYKGRERGLKNRQARQGFGQVCGEIIQRKVEAGPQTGVAVCFFPKGFGLGESLAHVCDESLGVPGFVFIEQGANKRSAMAAHPLADLLRLGEAQVISARWGQGQEEQRAVSLGQARNRDQVFAGQPGFGPAGGDQDSPVGGQPGKEAVQLLGALF